MIVLRIPVNGTPRVDKIGNKLEDLQACVGGYIEPCAPIQLRSKNIELLCNEDGILKGLDPNPNLFPFFFLGDMVAVGVGKEDFVSLNADQYAFIMDWLEGLQDG